MTYQPGQFRNILPFVKRVPKWFILGGPADGDEAQCAVEAWPGVQVLGIEPDPRMRQWQLEHGWPGGPGDILEEALSDERGWADMMMPEHGRCSSLMPDRPGVKTKVRTITLNLLHGMYGPFKDAVLWLDIEGWELQALQGASDLFFDKAIIAVNLEILERREEVTRAIDSFMRGVEFELAGAWNHHPGSHHDRVYVPQGTGGLT